MKSQKVTLIALACALMSCSVEAAPQIASVKVLQEKRGQEVEITFAKDSDFTAGLAKGEQYNLALLFVPGAKEGQVAGLLKEGKFVQKYTTWTFVRGAPNGYPEFKSLAYIGGNFDNPNGGPSANPGALMVILGAFQEELLSPTALQKAGKVKLPFQPWIMGPGNKLQGSGKLAVALAKSSDHYLKDFALVSNVVEVNATVPSK